MTLQRARADADRHLPARGDRRGKKEALLAPRAAVLPGRGSRAARVLFTVKDGQGGQARGRHRHRRRRERGNHHAARDALAEGTSVVTEGAYELEDKMPVEIGQRRRSECQRKSRVREAGQGSGRLPRGALAMTACHEADKPRRTAPMTARLERLGAPTSPLDPILAGAARHGRRVQRMEAAGGLVPAGGFPAHRDQFRRGRPAGRAHGNGSHPRGGKRRARRARRAARALDHQPRQRGAFHRLRLGPGHGLRALADRERRQPDAAHPARRHALRGAAHGHDRLPRARLQPDFRHALAGRPCATWRSTSSAPLLSTVNGVAKIDVQGGAVEEIHVTTDPARLAAYGLTVADLSKALAGRERARPPSAAWRTTTSSTCCSPTPA